MKTTRRILLFFLFVLSYTSFCQQVHYTRTGKKYHSKGCQYLRKSDFICTLEEAFSRGLGPCSRCNPPTQIVKDVSPEPVKPAIPRKSIKKRAKPKRISYYQNLRIYNIPLQFPG